ncbi:MAG: acyloxyacyl hydrolase, partial [Odoribacter sp.]|nr:acyloxyacyl hydrolase [Odoribacter sp.]
YQGAGIGYFRFGNTAELGNPVALYLFQGARIATFSSRMSFNYEWNFGLSLGWKPYDPEYNAYNVMVGSKMNAYINTNFYFDWVLSSFLNLNAGIWLAHFSNGNSRFPNAGLNMVDFKAGLVCHLNRQEPVLSKMLNRTSVPAFPRHVSYDLTLFGSWRRKGYFSEDGFVPSPNAYKVLGVNLAAMYNVSYKFRTGVSLDWVYDASANVFVLSDPSTPQGFVKPPFNAQIALGASGRVEYVTPYFIVGVGMGANILHRGGDLRSFYQMLILKISVTRSTYLHIGYNLKDFRDPNFLMLGLGFRFNNKYPERML